MAALVLGQDVGSVGQGVLVIQGPPMGSELELVPDQAVRALVGSSAMESVSLFD